MEKSKQQEYYMPQSFSEALRMLANEIEQKELAIKQRDEAVKYLSRHRNKTLK